MTKDTYDLLCSIFLLFLELLHFCCCIHQPLEQQMHRSGLVNNGYGAAGREGGVTVLQNLRSIEVEREKGGKQVN